MELLFLWTEEKKMGALVISLSGHFCRWGLLTAGSWWDVFQAVSSAVLSWIVLFSLWFGGGGGCCGVE